MLIHAHGEALANSFQIAQRSCQLFLCAGKLDATAPTGTYYVMLVDSATPPVNGAVTVKAVIPVPHTLNTDDLVEVPIRKFIPMASGAYWCLSSTDGTTLTLAGAFLRLFTAEGEG